ncbi:hypothetical protein [Mesorhizobium sp. NBSH29]|uniref:hypothetical protein n=1 Tax=Mesorhizobium sp. NBSH29 TaxID=2654249 RepID=UPI001896971C|nr:hypothetical protein [Mesorhizobium sp. NBSH29]
MNTLEINDTFDPYYNGRTGKLPVAPKLPEKKAAAPAKRVAIKSTLTKSKSRKPV